MAKYAYQARASNGQVVNGQIEALDEGEARVRLRAKNLIPIRVVGGGPPQKKSPDQLKKVGSRELQIFTRQFSTLVNAGIPIVDSLKMLSQGAGNPVLQEVATKVKNSIESGKRLAEAMGTFPGVFDRLYVNLVHAGEEAGILDGILGRLAIYLEKSEKIKKQVKGALVYPIAILVVAAIVISAILVFIIPKFQDLYASSGKELPGLTKMVVNLSQLMIKKWHIILLSGGAVIYGIKMYIESPEGSDEFDRIIIRAPVFGDLVQKSAMARMSRTLSTLLSSGVGLIDALEIAAKTAGNRVLEEALLRAKDSVMEGKPLAQPLSKEKMFPEMVTQMIAIGESSGTVDVMLGKVADFYEDDVENAVKSVTALIEPFMMVFLGGAIAILVLAMYLPIFNMASLG